MAAAIKALNARIRKNPVLDYVCSTHFWGPVSNFGIPLAAIADISKDPEIISGRMTVALTGYSAVFMRYSMAVTPKNYLLFACHVTNFTSQMTQGYRFVDYWYMGGKDKARAKKAELEKTADKLGAEAQGLANQAKDQASQALEKGKELVGKK